MNEPSKALRALAVVLLAASAGIAAFWVHWFAASASLETQDELYRTFENTFPLPDGVLALVLVATAVLLWRGSDLAGLFGLLGCGMLLYLASLDTWYHLVHDGFLRWQETNTWLKVAIALLCYGLGAVLWFAFCTVGEHRPLKKPRVTLSMTIVLLSVGIAAEALYVYCLVRANGLLMQYAASFVLAQALSVCFGAMAASRIAQRQERILGVVLCFCGMELFHSLIHATFLAQHPLLGGAPGDVSILSLCAFRVLFVITLAIVAWMERPEQTQT